MERERVCEELADAKVEIEKLREDLKRKADLSENLKSAHQEQVIRIQEANSKIEGQVQELNEKTGEISAVKKICEELQCRLNEKESIIRHLSSANDKLRVDSNEKDRRWEEEKRGLVLALDEANEKNLDQEQKINAFMVEMEGLKMLLSVSKKKCLEVEENAKASKELRKRDDILVKLEEENQKLEDQLKWKKEQFKHLEEAHEKLRANFTQSKKEWEMEKTRLIDEICSLQASLDSQVRISEDLQNRLKMCNQALAHEESRRKQLEVEVSEFKTRFENVSGECQETKLQLECLSNQRDKEIAALRSALSTKDTIYKEIRYQAGKLEQENKELLSSIKELQEAQIQEVGSSSSLAKLRNKLKTVEKMHRDCSANLRAKEAEWSSRLQNLTGEQRNCQAALESKEAAVKELRMELENSHSVIMQLTMQQEEACIMLLVLKSEITQVPFGQTGSETDLHNKERDEKFSLLEKQLELKNTALAKALKDVEEEREKAASLLKRGEEELKEIRDALTKAQFKLGKAEAEINRLNNERDEAVSILAKQLESKNIALAEALAEVNEERKKSASLLKRDEGELQVTNGALKAANSELAAKVCEAHAVEFELWIWKSIAQRLKDDLEENQALRKELEASLIAQIGVGEIFKQEKDGLVHLLESKERRIDALQQQIEFLEQEQKTRELDAAALMSSHLEKESFLHTMKDKDKILEDLQKEIMWLEQESLRREFEGVVFTQMVAERTFKHEKENLLQVMENKNQRMDDLLKHVRLLEEKFNSSLVSFSSELANKQTEVSLIHEAWEKIAAAKILAQLEIEEKKLMIMELEDDICSVQQKLEAQEKTLSASKQKAQQVETELETKQLEMKRLSNVMETKLRTSETLVDELKSENRKLVQDVKKLSSERENLLDFVVTIGERINEFSSEDSQLTVTLEGMLQSADKNASGQVLKIGTEAFAKENANAHPSPTAKLFPAVHEERSPFRELN